MLTTLVGTLIFGIPYRRCTNVLVKLLCSSCYVPLWNAVLIHKGCQSCMLLLPGSGRVYTDTLAPLRGAGTMGLKDWHGDRNSVQVMPAQTLIALHTMQSIQLWIRRDFILCCHFPLINRCALNKMLKFPTWQKPFCTLKKKVTFHTQALMSMTSSPKYTKYNILLHCAVVLIAIVEWFTCIIHKYHIH